MENKDNECDANTSINMNETEKNRANKLIKTFSGFQVIMGGGRREFLPNTTTPDNVGRRLDRTDLLDLWHVDKVKKNASHQYVADRNELMQVRQGLVATAVKRSRQKHIDKQQHSNM